MRSTGKLHHRLAHRQGCRTDKVSTDSEHTVSRLGIHPPLQSERFTDDPFQPVSPDCALDVAVDTDPYPLGAIVAWAMNKGKASTMQAPAAAINPIELPSLAKMGFFREAKLTQRIRQTGACAPEHGDC